MTATDIVNSGYTEESRSLVLATLLENQRKLNEQDDDYQNAEFKRISIPLIRRAYPPLPRASEARPTLSWLCHPNKKYKKKEPVNWKKEGF